MFLLILVVWGVCLFPFYSLYIVFITDRQILISLYIFKYLTPALLYSSTHSHSIFVSAYLGLYRSRTLHSLSPLCSTILSLPLSLHSLYILSLSLSLHSVSLSLSITFPIFLYSLYISLPITSSLFTEYLPVVHCPSCKQAYFLFALPRRWVRRRFMSFMQHRQWLDIMWHGAELLSLAWL